jgi:hypothetical protein
MREAICNTHKTPPAFTNLIGWLHISQLRSSFGFYPTGILGRRMSCMTAHTMVKQLVRGREGVNLIGALPHIARRSSQLR